MLDAPIDNVSRWQVLSVTVLALTAFAANSVLCRLALASGSIDAGMFTAVRICAGALALLALVRGRIPLSARGGLPALMLFAYAACFSLAYLDLSTGTGALLLFGAVQVTMILGGIVYGERPGVRAWLGWATACAGLVYLVMPGIEAPPLTGAILMVCAGAAWGLYSLWGKRESDPVGATARNFVLATPLAVALFLATHNTGGNTQWDGIAYASASGAITSGLGYVIWYFALKHISSILAAIAQLTVPIIAALGGIVFLSEDISLRLAAASALTLGGVALAISSTYRRGRDPNRTKI